MDVLRHAPALTADEASALALRLYGVQAAASPLPSERDQNFLLRTPSDDRFVLKIANRTDDRALLEAQNAALAHVGRSSTLCPRVIPTRDGDAIAELPGRHLVRLLTWLPGAPLATVADPSPELLASLGSAVAELDAALESFDHPAVHREFHWDLARGLALVRDLSPRIADPALRALVERVAQQIDFRDGPRLDGLRRAVVHNDPNDYNVLVDARVTGILDFGDIVHS